MRLTRLDLHGFKSFADATDLVFEPGVTAIVGPNGCGKSNVSDAVRWVLGEQRARLLRGAKMEEVIFQGSSARRAVNVAEVSLHFENEDGSLPVPFQEVVITRRLSRSGESEYLLNSAPCRLRDIHDMLRGTGLAADAGVVIESKMIDALLSDRPDDRRELFEEAAGVGLYRDRRRSTERRLEETTTDLQRLDDLLSEVQSQVRSLARQRKRAERHAELTARRYVVELTLATREMAAWRDELARLETRVAELRTALPAAEADVRRAEENRDAGHSSRAAAEGHRSELARLVAQQRDRLRELQSEVAVARERQRNALARRHRAEEEQTESARQEEKLAAELAAAAQECQTMEQALQAASEQLRQRGETEQTAREALARARAALERLDGELRARRDRASRLELERDRAQRELDELDERTERLQGERVQLVDRLQSARREHEATADALETARSESEQAEADLATARGSERLAREQDAAARSALFTAEEAVASLRARVRALETLERERVGLAPAAARLLEERARFGEGSILGPLSDYIAAGEQPAALVERYLGNSVHAVLVRDREVAESIRRWHAEAQPGPLLLLPLSATADVQPPTAGGGLAALVEADPVARGWVQSLLGQVIALEAGEAFVDARGALWLPGAESGPGPLRRRAELAAAATELESLEQQQRAAASHAETMRATLDEAQQRLTSASEFASAAQAEVRRAQEAVGERHRRLGRIEGELADADALGHRLQARRTQLTGQIDASKEEGRRLADQIADDEAALEDARSALAQSEAALESAREERSAAQIEQAQSQARLQVATDRQRRLTGEIATAASRMQSLRAELSDLSEADRALAEQMARWQLDLDLRAATLADSEARLAAAEEGVAAAEHALTAAEHGLDAARRHAAAVSDELHHAELRFTELSGKRGAIRERLETEWRRPLDEMLATLEPLELEDAELREEAEQLRQSLDALGPVNPLAIEEHDEEQKRFEFLSRQRDDLASAKLSLQQAIREIDVTARELFLETFVQVRENFRQIFMTLFGGGECDLRLEDQERPLDCDIEIHASPRGKRTQRIHLLSSGERSLVALSLLFGIFLTKPSPFCLLDEVDAPLDDANIGRFVRMLNQFKTRTQFIVITHNPRTTTEAADAVYGVTMQEPGVSSLVSVRIPRTASGAPIVDREVVEELAGRADETGGEREPDEAEALSSPA